MEQFGTRHKNILDADNSLLLVVDVQERFASHILGFEAMLGHICTLVKAAKELDLPIIVSEQYTRGLGPTVAAVKELEDKSKPWHWFEKNCFSAVTADNFLPCLQEFKRKQIIVCGIETHVCVNQTVHELLQRGYQPHIVVEAVSSRSQANKDVGLQKMFASGALPATVEMVLFEMLVEAGTSKFKQVQSLVK